MRTPQKVCQNWLVAGFYKVLRNLTDRRIVNLDTTSFMEENTDVKDL